MQLQVLIGIEYVHRKQIVHCDLKPSNIVFFGADLRWKLIDFDMARKANKYRATSFTAAYAAPEALKEFYREGNLPLARPSLDLWSFGIIAYEVITGRWNFFYCHAAEG